MKILRKIFEKIFLKSIDTMDFGTSMGLCDLPVVTFYQGDKKFNFLLDTGSTDNVIDSGVMDTIKSTPVNIQSNLIGMEGNTRVVRMCQITLFFKEHSYTYNYLINDMKSAFDNIKKNTGVQLHGIIGSKFFNRFKYVLDFKELIAYSKQ